MQAVTRADEEKGMTEDTISLVRRVFDAYGAKDRAAIEAVIADDFHFTSPLDNRIDRQTYFERCWKNSEAISGFSFINLAREGDRVFVTYEGRRVSGKAFRNTEVFTVRNGQIVEIEVYFGWWIPHEVPVGGFVDP
jgi:ketosteroid isomerase-like protein